MLDYKDIVTKHFALGMSGSKIAEYLKVSKSGVNDFLRAFKECEKIGYPLPEGITNYGIKGLHKNSNCVSIRKIENIFHWTLRRRSRHWTS